MKRTLIIICLMILCTSCENRAVPTPVREQSAKSICMPFELYCNEIFFQAGIDESGPLWFILDTGCSISTFNEKTIKELGIHTGSKTDNGYLGVGDQPVLEAPIDSIRLHIQDTYIEINDSAVAVSLDTIEAVSGHPVDGVIGREIFEKYVVEINPSAKLCTLYECDQYEYSGKGASIPLLIDGVPYMNATLVMPDNQSIDGRFMVDNGFAGAISITGPFSQQNNIINKIKNTIPMINIGAGGTSDTRIGRISGIKIGSYEITNPLVTIFSDTKGGMSRSDISGYIGNEILKRYKAIFDYSRNRMILEPDDGIGEPMETDMSGLYIYAGGTDFDQIIVYGTIPGSPADQAGIEAGDILDTVDGKKASTYTIDGLNKLFRSDGKQYRLGIVRNGEVIDIDLKLKKLV